MFLHLQVVRCFCHLFRNEYPPVPTVWCFVYEFMEFMYMFRVKSPCLNITLADRKLKGPCPSIAPFILLRVPIGKRENPTWDFSTKNRLANSGKHEKYTSRKLT